MSRPSVAELLEDAPRGMTASADLDTVTVELQSPARYIGQNVPVGLWVTIWAASLLAIVVAAGPGDGTLAPIGLAIAGALALIPTALLGPLVSMLRHSAGANAAPVALTLRPDRMEIRVDGGTRVVRAPVKVQRGHQHLSLVSDVGRTALPFRGLDARRAAWVTALVEAWAAERGTASELPAEVRALRGQPETS